MEEVGTQLRARARVLGLSDAEVARRVGLGQTRYANYVNGTREPDFITLVRICEVLDTTPNALLGFGAKQPKRPAAEALRRRIAAASEEMDVESLLVAAEVVEAIAQRAVTQRRS